MNRLLLLVSVVATAFAAGCAQWRQSNVQQTPAPLTDTAQAGGIELSLTVPRGCYLTGETICVAVRATNTTDQPICIESPTGALVELSVQRCEGVRWDEVKRYPQAAIMALSPWTLEPEASRDFTMEIPVEQDWPTYEPLKLVASLNGGPPARPEVVISVRRP